MKRICSRSYRRGVTIVEIQLDRFAHLGPGAFAIFALGAALQLLFHFGLLLLLALLFFLPQFVPLILLAYWMARTWSSPLFAARKVVTQPAPN